MAKNSVSLGRMILQIALGLILAIGGIWALQEKGGDEAVKFLRGLKDLSFLAYVFGVIELLSGILLILQLFIGDKLGKLDDLLSWIVIAVFALVIIFADICGDQGLFGDGGLFKNKDTLKSVYNLCGHLVMLGAMWSLKD